LADPIKHCKVKTQSPSQPRSLQSGADLHFLSHQPDTSLHCKAMDTWLVHHGHGVSVYMQLCWYSLHSPTEASPPNET